MSGWRVMSKIASYYVACWFRSCRNIGIRLYMSNSNPTHLIKQVKLINYNPLILYLVHIKFAYRVKNWDFYLQLYGIWRWRMVHVMVVAWIQPPFTDRKIIHALQVYNSTAHKVGVHTCRPYPNIPWSCALVMHLL